MNKKRIWMLVLVVFVLFLIARACSVAADKKQADSSKTASGDAASVSGVTGEVPWDYQVREAKVGDLLDGDMVLLPNNERISNDQNFATGEQIWVLSSIQATMKADSQGKNDVTLSQWKPIKTFKTKEEADKDLAELKVEIKTEVKLVGVYKTELDGKFRYFAVVELPTGQKVKQPIPEERYTDFKSKKDVQVILEEVHDYSNYDQSMAKFRGWAE
ncbi:signal peptide protein [Paenibacillus alba]|uniref:hypothetical protein n=1 Tax=Paenibacillus alba TaxID=1197127 RepID=UPI001565F800|nr:hypothetical protein [Paenibacillus alba]NQX67927.1 signal peptide protein [Paenibacillus alba]